MTALIRQGKLCQGCSRGCKDVGTEAEPNVIDCPECNGDGCIHCDDLGEINLTGCPNEFCKEIVPAIDLFDLFHKGLPPVSGGVLDQAAWFIKAARQMKNDETQAKG